MKLVIFTDLDGTLLDDSYSFGPALPALEMIRAKGIPWVICSSKTSAEIEYYRTRLFNTDPFAAENGGAIYIPKGYFHGVEVSSRNVSSTSEKYIVISLGEPYENLRTELLRLRAEGFRITGFGDMTAQEISRLSGLRQEEAKLAKQRKFDEPFVFEGNEKELQSLVDHVHRNGFSCVRGTPFHHLTGGNDKGKAVSIIMDLYRREFGKIFSAALGDGPNDISMLQAADHPIAVPRMDGSIDPAIRSFSFAEADAPGPLGWNKTVLDLITNQVL